MQKRTLVLTIMLALSLILSACSQPATPQTSNSSQPTSLRFAALRILDSLPLFVAAEQGYFEQNGLDVKLIPVGSAPERDQLIASGQADGMINEVMSTLFANRDAITVQIVRTARAADKDHPVFRILAGKDTGVSTVNDLSQGEIGISEGTIIEYVTDRLLEADGYDSAGFPKVNIPAIPDRLALLNSGELFAATLPEPASTIAEQNGAVNVIDDSAHPEYGYSTIAFRNEFIDANPDAMKAFLRAIERAVEDINNDPAQWDSILIDRELVPPTLVGNYPVPPFITATIPTEAQFRDAVAWAKSKGYISGDPAYEEMIRSEFLP
jgi:NitT/TauT family transport system substrate-binding protein